MEENLTLERMHRRPLNEADVVEVYGRILGMLVESLDRLYWLGGHRPAVEGVRHMGDLHGCVGGPGGPGGKSRTGNPP